MKELKTFEVTADLGMLQRSCESGYPAAQLESVLGAMVTEIVSRTRAKPMSVYLFSPDSGADARDRFAFLLTKFVREHVPTALLVDCAFLSTGLSGIVPHRDALGFLDLLLYGTSTGVITQESAHGVKVVGAGSFNVTKKSPFVMDAFASARRYLANQAKCVIFVGPATDDEERLHPLAENVDLAVLVRAGERFAGRVLDPLEEAVAALEGVEAWSVRIHTRAATEDVRRRAPEPRVTPEPRPASEPALVAEVEELVDKIAEGPRTTAGASGGGTAEPIRPAPAAERPAAPGAARAGGVRGPFGEERKMGGSRFIRAAAAVVAVALVVFVVWWLYLTRSVREGDESTAVPSAVTRSAAGGISEADSLAAANAARDRVESLIARNRTMSAPGSRPEAVSAGPAPGETAERGAGSPAAVEPERRAPALSTADNIHLAETLDEFADQYIVHVSSFQGIEKAREEARDLVGWGYPVFMYRVDLGSKGTWYRVYVGPYATREAAMEHKIKLDENPRIKSTRISKVPG